MKQLIAICLFAILFASCSNSTDTSNQAQDDLMPLKVGNYWIYEYKEYSLTNKDSLVNQYLDTMLVENSILIDNKTLFKLKNNFTYSSDANGLWVYFINGNVIMDKGLFFKYPSKVNDINTFSPLKMQVKTISTNENVKTDLGEFICYKYHLTNEYNNGFDYFAPKIGFIKSTNKFYSHEFKDTVISYQTLVSYHLE